MLNTTTCQQKFVLKFAESSEWPGQYVDLDRASGGYPVAKKFPMAAHTWDNKEQALGYASMFTPESNSYKAYAIEQKVYIITTTVTEEPEDRTPNLFPKQQEVRNG